MKLLMILCFSLVFASCGKKKEDSVKDTIIEGVTSGDCSEQLKSDFIDMGEKCDLPNRDVSRISEYHTCEKVIASFKESYPKLNCKFSATVDGKEKSAQVTNENIAEGEKINHESLYLYKSGQCGVQVLHEFNETSPAKFDENSKKEIQSVIDKLTKIQERYAGINCTATYNDKNSDKLHEMSEEELEEFLKDKQDPNLVQDGDTITVNKKLIDHMLEKLKEMLAKASA